MFYKKMVLGGGIAQKVSGLNKKDPLAELKEQARSKRTIDLANMRPPPPKIEITKVATVSEIKTPTISKKSVNRSSPIIAKRDSITLPSLKISVDKIKSDSKEKSSSKIIKRTNLKKSEKHKKLGDKDNESPMSKLINSRVKISSRNTKASKNCDIELIGKSTSQPRYDNANDELALNRHKEDLKENRNFFMRKVKRRECKSKWMEEPDEDFLVACDSFDLIYQREFEKVFDVQDSFEDMTVERDGYKILTFSPIKLNGAGKIPIIKTFPKSYFLIHFENALIGRDVSIYLNPTYANKTAFLVSKRVSDPDYLDCDMIIIRDSYNFSLRKSMAKNNESNSEYCLTLKVLAYNEQSYNIVQKIQKTKKITEEVFKDKKQVNEENIAERNLIDDGLFTNKRLIVELKKMNMLGNYVDKNYRMLNREFIMKNMDEAQIWKYLKQKIILDMIQQWNIRSEEAISKRNDFILIKRKEFITLKMKQAKIIAKNLFELKIKQKQLLTKVSISAWLYILYLIIAGHNMYEYIFQLRMQTFNDTITRNRIILVQSVAKSFVNDSREVRNQLPYNHYCSALILEIYSGIVRPKVEQKSKINIARFFLKIKKPLQLFGYITTYIDRIREVKKGFVKHKELKRRIYETLEKDFQREIQILRTMDEYNFRKACIIVGIRGNEPSFKSFSFTSYRHIFNKRLISEFIGYYLNKIITNSVEQRVKNNFANLDFDAARTMYVKQADGEQIDSLAFNVEIIEQAIYEENLLSYENLSEEMQEANYVNKHILDNRLIKKKYKYKIGVLDKQTDNKIKGDIHKMSLMTSGMFIEFFTKPIKKEIKQLKGVNKDKRDFKERLNKLFEEGGSSIVKNTGNFIEKMQKKVLIDDYLKEYRFSNGMLKSMSFVIIKYFVEGQLPEYLYKGKIKKT